MDTITQMLFGATVAQAGFRRSLGRGAMAAGAVLGLVPDLDVAVGWVAGPFANWEHHRGFTHSLLFGPLFGPLFGYWLWRLSRRGKGPPQGEAAREGLRAWIWLSILALLTHPLIDLFTSYGTQLLWPFTNVRFAINAMPIIDPLYSLVLVAALVVGARKRASPRFAQDAAASALLFIAVYSFGGWAINDRVERVARAEFAQPAEITAYPLLLQPYYRRVVAFTPDAAHVGYYSVLNPRPIRWQAYPVGNGDGIAAVRGTREGALFEWFSMDKTLWRSRPDGNGGTIVEATDLRYGMPGATDMGFWGIRAHLDAANALISDIETFANPREADGAALSRFWSEMTGL
jgi:inner membrane protein